MKSLTGFKESLDKLLKKKRFVKLGGDAIESFERVEPISEIILLGFNGGIRRIILYKDDAESKKIRRILAGDGKLPNLALMKLAKFYEEKKWMKK